MWGRGIISVLAAALVGSAAACAHPNALPGDEVSPSAPIGVQVDNENFNDLNVYAVSGGMARRLGTVIGSSKSTFSLASSYATRDLYIVAVPIGGYGRASTGLMNLSPGDTLEFTVGPRLTNNGLFIR